MSMVKRCRQINCCGRGNEDEERWTSPRSDCGDCPSGRWEDGQSGRRVERWRRGDQGPVFPARNGQQAPQLCSGQQSGSSPGAGWKSPQRPIRPGTVNLFRCLFGVSAAPRPVRNSVPLWGSKACSQSIPSLSLTDESGVTKQTTTSSMNGTPCRPHGCLQYPYHEDGPTLHGKYAKAILGLCAPSLAAAGESLHGHCDVFTRCPSPSFTGGSPRGNRQPSSRPNTQQRQPLAWDTMTKQPSTTIGPASPCPTQSGSPAFRGQPNACETYELGYPRHDQTGLNWNKLNEFTKNISHAAHISPSSFANDASVKHSRVKHLAPEQLM